MGEGSRLGCRGDMLGAGRRIGSRATDVMFADGWSGAMPVADARFPGEPVGSHTPSVDLNRGLLSIYQDAIYSRRANSNR